MVAPRLNFPSTILLVDDVVANRDTLRELLETDEYRLVEACDGPTALRLARETPPDLVLLDVMMPGMDGYEVCRQLRADSQLAEVPVIMLTALDDQASRIAGIKAGADDFLTKPFNSAELRARARTITRLNRYRRLLEAQAASRLSEERFRALFELGPVAICSCDASGALQDYNRRAAELWGRDPIAGDSATRFCGAVRLFRPDGSALSHEQSAMAEVLKGAVPAVVDGEVMIERPDGSCISVLANVVPLRNSRGEITGAINCFHDITAQRAAEIAQRENEQWLKAVFNQAAVGVFQTDVATRRFRRFNQRFCDLLGYSRKEMALLSLPEVTHKADLDLDLRNQARLRNGSIREYTSEKRFIRKDGSVIWANVAVSLIGPPGEAPAAFIAVVLDITERKLLDEHFLHTQKMEALGQFSGGVAHDFNNILASISGYVELSRMKLKDNHEVRTYLDSVLKAASRAADLVRQIQTFSRQETQLRKETQLKPVVEESLKMLRAIIPSTIEFDMAVDAETPTVLANANQVHQVLMNLGINAWHAMRDRPGRIQVTLEKFPVDAAYAATKPRLRVGNYVRLSVGDTGCGMDAATLQRIFEPFFTTKPLGEGTGLGLSVVHGIMDSHDGAITVQSQPGEGTIFRLHFPVHVGEAAQADIEQGSVPAGCGERILVVDDEVMIAFMMQKTLVSLGYEAEAVTEPEMALAMVRADPRRFSAVLTDQTMPGMTGLVLASELRKARPGLPVILMTGYSLSLTSEGVEAAGICQLLLKPVAIHSLGTAVEAALSAPSVR